MGGKARMEEGRVSAAALESHYASRLDTLCITSSITRQIKLICSSNPATAASRLFSTSALRLSSCQAPASTPSRIR
jgi:hypothetical protein